MHAHMIFQMHIGLFLLIANGTYIPRAQMRGLLVAYQMVFEGKSLPAAIHKAPKRLILAVLGLRVPLELCDSYKGLGAQLAL